jgi:hypothetical protein
MKLFDILSWAFIAVIMIFIFSMVPGALEKEAKMHDMKIAKFQYREMHNDYQK